MMVATQDIILFVHIIELGYYIVLYLMNMQCKAKIIGQTHK